MGAPQSGSTHRLGNQIGEGDFALLPGTVVTVEEVVPAGTPGVEVGSEDIVIASATYPDVALDATGQYVNIDNIRRLALPVSRFRELFEPTEESSA